MVTMMVLEQATLFILWLMDILCNAFLLYAIWKLKKLNTISFRFVFCLSISDTLFGIFGVIREAIIATKKTPSETDAVLTPASYFFLDFSSGMILIIAIDRFIHMRYLIRYPTLMTNYKAIGLVIANVVFTTHILVIFFILPDYHIEFVDNNLHAYRVYCVILGFLYVFVMFFIFVMYFWTYYTLRKQVYNRVSFSTTTDKKGKKRDSRSHRNPSAEFAKGMMLILLCLFLLVVPNVILIPCARLIEIYGDTRTKQKALLIMAKVEGYTHTTIILNSSLNAIILIAFSSDLKAFTKRFFHCLKKRDVSPETGNMNTMRISVKHNRRSHATPKTQSSLL